MTGLDLENGLNQETYFLESLLLKGIKDGRKEVLNFCKNNYYSLYLGAIEDGLGTIEENEKIKAVYGD